MAVAKQAEWLALAGRQWVPWGWLASCERSLLARLCRDGATQQGEGEEPDPNPAPCGSVEDVLAVLQDDHRRAYFLTGVSRYSQNLDLLVPFFDSPSLELENIQKDIFEAPMEAPLIAIRGNTTYDLNEDFKVIRHSESWDVSALDAIAQIFVSAPEQLEGS